jgi:hypothetical protein
MADHYKLSSMNRINLFRENELFIYKQAINL